MHETKRAWCLKCKLQTAAVLHWQSSIGIEITDVLRFFKGDGPAKQFERGTQMGGNYKCGGCGCHSDMMEDLAHSLHLKWRSLAHLQTLALAGIHGGQSNVLKPFETLNTSQLQAELRKRNIFHSATTKKDCQAILAQALKGVQRVPTLLLPTPTKSLSSLNLDKYEILDSEPLHDLKGHLLHLFAELPFILDKDTGALCKQIISQFTMKEKITCADLRITAVQVYACLLQRLSSGDERLLLTETAVRISEILYLPTKERSPKRVLQLYNVTWVHHTLCSKLFTRTRQVTRTAFFGLYLHHLVVHAPFQYELISLSSVNTEAEERLFGQAKQLVTQASNRHVDNVIFNILVRLQSKELLNQSCMLNTLNEQYSRVSKAAACIRSYQGTTVSLSLIKSAMTSWQMHLQRIGPYLITGKGIWWSINSNSYNFHDADDDENAHEEGPQLLHFRDNNLDQLWKRNEQIWEQILERRVALPTPCIKLYDNKGKLMETRTFTIDENNSTGDYDTFSFPPTGPTGGHDTLSLPRTGPSGHGALSLPPTGLSGHGANSLPPTGPSALSLPPTGPSALSLPPTGPSGHGAHSLPPTGPSGHGALSLPPTGPSALSLPPTGPSGHGALSLPPTGPSGHGAHSLPPTGPSGHGAHSLPPTGPSGHGALSLPPTGPSALSLPPTGPSGHGALSLPPTGPSALSLTPTGPSGHGALSLPPTGPSGHGALSLPPTGPSGHGALSLPPTGPSALSLPPTGPSGGHDALSLPPTGPSALSLTPTGPIGHGTLSLPPTGPSGGHDALSLPPTGPSGGHDALSLPLTGPAGSHDTEDEIVIRSELDCQTVEHTVRGKTATAILEVIGPSEELMAYDNIRANIKNKNNIVTTADAREYNRLQTHIQTSILRKRTELKSEISQFEKECYAINKRMPRVTESEEYNQMIKKLKLIKHLLPHWNIDL